MGRGQTWGAALWAGRLGVYMVQYGSHRAQGAALPRAGERTVSAEAVAALQPQGLEHRLLHAVCSGLKIPFGYLLPRAIALLLGAPQLMDWSQGHHPPPQHAALARPHAQLV